MNRSDRLRCDTADEEQVNVSARRFYKCLQQMHFQNLLHALFAALDISTIDETDLSGVNTRQAHGVDSVDFRLAPLAFRAFTFQL